MVFVQMGSPASPGKSSLEIAVSGKDLNSNNPSHVLDGFDLVQNWISIGLVLVLKFALVRLELGSAESLLV